MLHAKLSSERCMKGYFCFSFSRFRVGTNFSRISCRENPDPIFCLFVSKQKKVSSFAEDASKVILKQASGEGASSETIQKASEAVFGAAVNCMLSVDTPPKDEQVRQGGYPWNNHSSGNHGIRITTLRGDY